MFAFLPTLLGKPRAQSEGGTLAPARQNTLDRHQKGFLACLGVQLHCRRSSEWFYYFFSCFLAAAWG